VACDNLGEGGFQTAFGVIAEQLDIGWWLHLTY
jgi:hypothetical protein